MMKLHCFEPEYEANLLLGYRSDKRSVSSQRTSWLTFMILPCITELTKSVETKHPIDAFTTNNAEYYAVFCAH